MAALPTTSLPVPASPRRRLTRLAGRSFLPLGFAARLPTAMLPMGILLYVVSGTGSYAAAGAVLAAFSLGAALGGPAVGVLADRFGQRRTMLALTGAGTAGLGALVGVGPGAALPLAAALAALTGASNPQVGSLARSRWTWLCRRSDDPGAIGPAMAYESVSDEASFVAGPVLVAVLATLVGPGPALAVAAVLGLAATTGFACHRTALPGHPRTAERPRPEPVPRRALAPLAVAMAAVGLVFGATQAGVVARLDGLGLSHLGGAVYAAMGVGSAAAAWATTRIPATVPLPRRIVLAGAALALTGGGYVVATGPVGLSLACLAVGVAVAPIMVSCYAAADRCAPAGRTSTVMTLLATAATVGAAAGAAAAGVLVDTVSIAAALGLPVLAGVVAAVAGTALRARLAE